jgi:hypothetical protein
MRIWKEDKEEGWEEGRQTDELVCVHESMLNPSYSSIKSLSTKIKINCNNHLPILTAISQTPSHHEMDYSAVSLLT